MSISLSSHQNQDFSHSLLHADPAGFLWLFFLLSLFIAYSEPPQNICRFFPPRKSAVQVWQFMIAKCWIAFYEGFKIQRIFFRWNGPTGKLSGVFLSSCRFQVWSSRGSHSRSLGCLQVSWSAWEVDPHPQVAVKPWPWIAVLKIQGGLEPDTWGNSVFG